jgi:putative membrane protein
MMGYMFGGMWLWMVFGFIVFVLFWGGVIWLIVWAVKKATDRGGTINRDGNAVEIARARYARGEITWEQFEQIKKNLT